MLNPLVPIPLMLKLHANSLMLTYPFMPGLMLNSLMPKPESR